MKLKAWVKCALYIIALYAVVVLSDKYPAACTVIGFIMLAPAFIIFVFIIFGELVDQW